LAYLQPSERVWWLKISFSAPLPLGKANNAPANSLAVFDRYLTARGRKRTRKGREGKGKEKMGRKKWDKITLPAPEINGATETVRHE